MATTLNMAHRSREQSDARRVNHAESEHIRHANREVHFLKHFKLLDTQRWEAVKVTQFRNNLRLQLL